MEEKTVNESRSVRNGTSWIAVFFICLSMIISAGLLAYGLSRFRSVESHTIGATGSASVDFESDLIIWRGSFDTHAETTDMAFRQIKKDAMPMMLRSPGPAALLFGYSTFTIG